ncbi:MAG TPA: hypothetical protein VKT70_14445 [Stellaceae bacterium]|nr:hypothetical protein [Stellaceae bacterium]
MEYRTLHQLTGMATIDAQGALSRRDKLRRWADLLEARGGTVRMLRGTEYVPARRRGELREEGSALSVAFADPVLRAYGLKDDSYGAAAKFFGLSQIEMHRILCYCHAGEAVEAKRVGEAVRCAADRLSGLAACAMQLAIVGAALLTASALAGGF